MNVYFCLSEELYSGGFPYGDPPEPPEWYCVCHIVAAETRSKARYLSWKHHNNGRMRHEKLSDMPNYVVRKLGVCGEDAGVLQDDDADPWWAIVPDGIPPPKAS